MKKGAYVVAVILVLIFVIRGIILPVINRAGGGNTEKPQQVQAETDSTTTDSSSDSTDTGDTSTETNAAIRQPDGMTMKTANGIRMQMAHISPVVCRKSMVLHITLMITVT